MVRRLGAGEQAEQTATIRRRGLKIKRGSGRPPMTGNGRDTAKAANENGNGRYRQGAKTARERQRHWTAKYAKYAKTAKNGNGRAPPGAKTARERWKHRVECAGSTALCRRACSTVGCTDE